MAHYCLDIYPDIYQLTYAYLLAILPVSDIYPEITELYSKELYNVKNESLSKDPTFVALAKLRKVNYIDTLSICKHFMIYLLVYILFEFNEVISPGKEAIQRKKRKYMVQVSLPLGRWKMNNHGIDTRLTITAVNADGSLQASLSGGVQVGVKQVDGTWDETAQNISFIDSDPTSFTTYNGHLSQNVIAGVPQFTLSGHSLLTIRHGHSPQSLVPWSALFMACVSDTNIYPIPSAPVLPPAGGTFLDPTFHTTIMRVTDQSDGNDNKVAYSYWPTFNKDSSRLLINTTNNGLTLYNFNSAAFQISDKHALPAANGQHIQWQGTIWSGMHPDILYGFEGLNLWQCDVSTNTYTRLKNFGAIFPGLELWQMSMSLDDNTFAFSVCTQGTCSQSGASPSAVVGYCVWQRNTDSFILNRSTPNLDAVAVDEVHIDKSGKFLVVGYDKGSDPPQGTIIMRVWDLTTNTATAQDLTDGQPDFAPGHYDTGTGTLVGHDRFINRTTLRNLSTPHTILADVLQLGNDSSQDYHISMLADDESNALISLYVPKNPPSVPDGLFHNEIILVSTDGLNRCRLAHHRSYVNLYEDQPHANISRDGWYVAYTSNWDNSGQRDVFIVQVP
jgi:hypothetical protein